MSNVNRARMSLWVVESFESLSLLSRWVVESLSHWSLDGFAISFGNAPFYQQLSHPYQDSQENAGLAAQRR